MRSGLHFLIFVLGFSAFLALISPSRFYSLLLGSAEPRLRVSGISEYELDQLLPRDKSFAWWLSEKPFVKSQLLKSPTVSAVELGGCEGSKLSCLELKVKRRAPLFRLRLSGRSFVVGSDGEIIRSAITGRLDDRMLPLVRLEGDSSSAIQSFSERIDGELPSLAILFRAMQERGMEASELVFFGQQGELRLRLRGRAFQLLLSLSSADEKLLERVESTLLALKERASGLKYIDARRPEKFILEYQKPI